MLNVKRCGIDFYMVHFLHPSADDISLSGIFAALGDPVRLKIFMSLMNERGCLSCTEATPSESIAKSTLSNHFRILRESGLIRTVKQGVENRNSIRRDEIDAKFPGLLKLVAKLAPNCPNA